MSIDLSLGGRRLSGGVFCCLAGAIAFSYFALASTDGVFAGVFGGSFSLGSSTVGRCRGGVLKELEQLTSSSSSHDTIGVMISFSAGSRFAGFGSCPSKSGEVST